MGITNPNEYDDAAWLAASNQLISGAEPLIEAMWEAGANPENVVEDINTVLENLEYPFRINLADPV